MSNPSQIAVEAASKLAEAHGMRAEADWLAEKFQSAIEKATADMVPIEDVKPLLKAVKNERGYADALANFISKHGEKLK